MATARCKRQNAATEVTAEWWGEAVLLERPRPNLRVPALNASGAGRGFPGLRCTGHRAVGSGGHRTNVDGGGRSGSDSATGAALHSVRSAMVLAVELCPGKRGALAGIVVLPRVGAPGVQRRPRGTSRVAGDPWTSRSGAGTDVGRITGHLTAAQPSWVRGETHDIRRDRQLYGVALITHPRHTEWGNNTLYGAALRRLGGLEGMNGASR